MVSGIGLALGFVAEKFLGAMLAKASADLLKKLDRDPAKQAFKEALGHAIESYATSGDRLLLASPLFEESKNFLAEDLVAEQLAKVVLFGEQPNTELIGQRWRAAMINPPEWSDFTAEAGAFVQYLETALRSTEVYRPVFEAQDINQILSAVSSSDESLENIVSSLDDIQSLLASQLSALLTRFGQAQPGIRRHIRDQTYVLREKARDFVGRRYVFDAIDAFLHDRTNGYFLLRGDPGIGKSAVAAQLVRQHGYTHHFNIRSQGVNSTEAFLRNTCSQLIAQYGLPYEALPPDATRDSGFLCSLLTQAAQDLPDNEQLVIVVDALDEVDRRSAPLGGNVLLLPNSLPDKTFVIATLRKDDLPLNVAVQETFVIEQDNDRNLADIHEYLKLISGRPSYRRYQQDQGINEKEFIEVLCDKSQGNFMYLHHVLPEIEKGAYTTIGFAALPEGLRNYYEDHWQRMKQGDEDLWFTHKLPVLLALTVASQPVSLDLIAKFSRIEQKARVRAVLQEWSQFLHEESIQEGGSTEKRYRLYHASFHDFVEAKEQVKEAGVDLQAAHEQISRVFVANMFEELN